MGVLSQIDPNTAQCNDGTSLTLNVYGSGFIGTDKINWDGADIGSTVVVNANKMTMTLNPSGAAGPRNIAVKVTGETKILYFHFSPGALHNVKTRYLAN